MCRSCMVWHDADGNEIDPFVVAELSERDFAARNPDQYRAMMCEASDGFDLMSGADKIREIADKTPALSDAAAAIDDLLGLFG